MKNLDLIVIVEDDEAIKKLLDVSFTKENFRTILCNTKKLALKNILSYNPNIVLIDIGLPDGDGKELVLEVRKSSQVPIIILSARSNESEIIKALNFGADDYVTKPFSIGELIARVKSLIRRDSLYKVKDTKIICDDLILDLINKDILFKEVALKLTPTEYKLLSYLILNANKTLTHHQILKDIWGVGYQNEMQYLRSYINTLRKKIEINSTRPAYIKTESGVGYRFCCSKNSKGEL